MADELTSRPDEETPMIIDRLYRVLGTALGFVLLSFAYADNWQRLHSTPEPTTRN